MEATPLTTFTPLVPSTTPGIELRFDTKYDLFEHVRQVLPKVMKNIEERDVQPLTSTSYRAYLLSKVNPWRNPVAHQLASIVTFASSYIPSPVSWIHTAIRGASALHQFLVPLAVFQRFTHAPQTYAYHTPLLSHYLVGLASSLEAAGLTAVGYNISDRSKNETLENREYLADFVFYAIFFGFLFVNSMTLNGEDNHWRTSERFALDQIDKAVQQLPQLKSDSRLTLRDDAGDPITLPTYIIDEEKGERKYYQLSALFDLITEKKIPPDTRVYFDFTYFTGVLDIIQKREPVPEGHAAINSGDGISTAPLLEQEQLDTKEPS